MALKDYLGAQLLGILASYQARGIVHHIGVVYPRSNNQLQVFIPKGHALALGSLVTLHLDNRTGVDELDAELRVYRTSYKGRIAAVDEEWVSIDPVEFILVHGFRVIEEYREPGYEYPADVRPDVALPVTPLRTLRPIEAKDHANKVGVLTTLAQGQPHTTVLAFLTTVDDDVFLISEPGTFKLQLLHRQPRCFFTIDERAKFTFEEAIEWNYSIFDMQAHQVPPELPIYEQVRSAFIEKIPFEAGFFSIQGLEVFHLVRTTFVFAGEPRPGPQLP